MREFFFNDASKVLDDPKVVQALTALYEYKGKQVLYLQTRSDVFESLCEFAKAQSTDASNRIEGISTSKKRLGDCGKPRTAEESQRAGDRGVPRHTCPYPREPRLHRHYAKRHLTAALDAAPPFGLLVCGALEG